MVRLLLRATSLNAAVSEVLMTFLYVLIMSDNSLSEN